MINTYVDQAILRHIKAFESKERAVYIYLHFFYKNLLLVINFNIIFSFKLKMKIQMVTVTFCFLIDPIHFHLGTWDLKQTEPSSSGSYSMFL